MITSLDILAESPDRRIVLRPDGFVDMQVLGESGVWRTVAVASRYPERPWRRWALGSEVAA